MFINKSNKYKFKGQFMLFNTWFKYILYLPQIGQNNKKDYLKYSNEIISYFGDRYINGKRCLNIDPDYIQQFMYNTDAYVIVYREDHPDDIASCTIQLDNPCIVNAPESDYQVYIYDLCRVKPNKVNKLNYKSPVYGLFYFIENLAYQNLSKTHIYLMVDTTVESTKNTLVNIYKNYGFILNDSDCIPISKRIILYKQISKSVIFHSSLSLFYLLKLQK